MRKLLLVLGTFCISISAFAGFKVKIVKPKKPDQFQVQTTVAGVTYAADLLLEGKNQKDYFYKELSPSNIIAVRLAIFNSSKDDVVLAWEGVKFIGPDGKEIAQVAPETVARAVLQGLVVSAGVKENRPVAVSPNVRVGDPRYDRSDPRYDPRMDPRDPTYDPRSDPNYDPRDPNGRRSGRQGPYIRPGVDVVLNPGSGQGTGDLSQFEKQLVEKDFQDKSHTDKPVQTSLARDKFLFFSLANPSANLKGFSLHLPAGKGTPQEIVLKF